MLRCRASSGISLPVTAACARRQQGRATPPVSQAAGSRKRGSAARPWRHGRTGWPVKKTWPRHLPVARHPEALEGCAAARPRRLNCVHPPLSQWERVWVREKTPDPGPPRLRENPPLATTCGPAGRQSGLPLKKPWLSHPASVKKTRLCCSRRSGSATGSAAPSPASTGAYTSANLS